MKIRDPAALRGLANGKLPPGTPAAALPRLRFDRVAQRVAKRLQESLAGIPPAKASLVVTITAPICMPGRTADELCVLLNNASVRNFDELVCGNRVRARVVPSAVRGSPRVIVFVHNPKPSPTELFRLVEALVTAK